MEYPALGTVQATDSGGRQPFLSSEEPEGREPDGLRFDRERACRLWEAVSAAQPVGREEGECRREGGVWGRNPLARPLLSREWRKREAGMRPSPRLYGPTPWLPARPLA